MQKQKKLHTIHTLFYMYLFLKMRGELAVGFTCVSPEVGFVLQLGRGHAAVCPHSTVIRLV